MTKILFTNTNCSVNKGSAAQVISTCETLRTLIPNLEITLMSHFPELDSKLCGIHNIKVISAMWLRLPHVRVWHFIYYRIFHLLFNILWAILFKSGLNQVAIKNPIIQEYVSADAIIDLSGDSFSDGKGGFSIATDSTILFGVSLKKPIVIYSQSIGPFKLAMTALARYCLSEASLVIVREEITKKYLEEIGIESPIYLTADCAFILEPAPFKMINDILLEEGVYPTKKPLIGISANEMLNDKENNYVTLMTQIIDYVIEKLNAHVIFVPHVIGIKEGGKGDDRVMGEKIYKLARSKENVDLIKGDYSPEELKGIIGLCDIFIGGRMHANIAAISSGVPTVATAWSHKYYGIMRTVGQEKYVCNFKTMNFEELKSKVDDLWENKEKIREELKVKVEDQKELAWHSGKLVRDLLNRKK
ncbi:polysaccharide pyruvyl transferase family protein [candidate division WOR-3 bacterium]|nr:polysaccharide pyruvyl transferase family protein [candidate division WOR-3 bacterium]